MTDDVFIQPLQLSDFTLTPSGDSPGFTQLVQDVLGSSASPLDGFDAAVTDTATIVDALDQALGEQDAALDAVLVSLSQTDPAPLDQSMQGYTSTISTGTQLVSDAEALAPPQLLEFPINPNMSGGAIAPPHVIGVDLGTVKVGSPAISHLLGVSTPTKTGRTGIENVSLVDGDPAIFKLTVVTSPPIRFQTRDGGTFYDYAYTYYLVTTPAKAGQFTGQVNSGTVPFAGFNIQTFSVAVVP